MAASEMRSWRSTLAVASWKHMAEAPMMMTEMPKSSMPLLGFYCAALEFGEAVRYLALRNIDRLVAVSQRLAHKSGEITGKATVVYIPCNQPIAV